MDESTVDLDRTVLENANACPRFVNVMVTLGFGEITNPAMMQTAGRVMTPRKGADVKGVDVADMVRAFREAGLTVVGAGEDAGGTPDREPTGASQRIAAKAPTSPQEARQAELAAMVRRLSDGEPLEEVRRDFVRDFSSVSAAEIAEAEQRLMRDGMPVREVQRLCDVHSALFHGMTAAEVEDEASCTVLTTHAEDGLPAGHPASVLRLENEGLTKELDALGSQVSEGADTSPVLVGLERIRSLKRHYGKKEQLLMPLLDSYGFDGPSNVMWGVDDEILRERSALAHELGSPGHETLSAADAMRVTVLLTRIREMRYKEENILLPLALEHFSREDWYACYRDLAGFGWAFCDGAPTWLDAEVWMGLQPKPENPGLEVQDGRVRLPTGSVSVGELVAVLKLLPVDLTFIDADERTRFFSNEGHVFDRPLACIDREVWSCHPPLVKPMIEEMLASFRAHETDHVERWIPNPQNPVRVVYHAVYDEHDEYIGTLEVVQQFGEVLEGLAPIVRQG